MKQLFPLLLAPLLFLAACGDKQDAINDGDGTDEPAGCESGDVTWANAVSELMTTNCTACHSSERSGQDRNGAPNGVNFNSYDAATDSAEEANERIQRGTMPPGGGLSQNQRDCFNAWVDNGAPE